MLLIFLFVKNRAQSWDFLEKFIKEKWNYEIVNEFKISIQNSQKFYLVSDFNRVGHLEGEAFKKNQN